LEEEWYQTNRRYIYPLGLMKLRIGIVELDNRSPSWSGQLGDLLDFL